MVYDNDWSRVLLSHNHLIYSLDKSKCTKKAFVTEMLDEPPSKLKYMFSKLLKYKDEKWTKRFGIPLKSRELIPSNQFKLIDSNIMCDIIIIALGYAKYVTEVVVGDGRRFYLLDYEAMAADCPLYFKIEEKHKLLHPSFN